MSETEKIIPIGAIIGDISGSTYEYEQFGKVHKVKDPIILGKDSFYTDDTILTIALLDAYLHKKNYEEKLKEYAFKYEKQKHIKFVLTYVGEFLLSSFMG